MPPRLVMMVDEGELGVGWTEGSQRGARTHQDAKTVMVGRYV